MKEHEAVHYLQGKEGEKGCLSIGRRGSTVSEGEMRTKSLGVNGREKNCQEKEKICVLGRK